VYAGKQELFGRSRRPICGAFFLFVSSAVHQITKLSEIPSRSRNGSQPTRVVLAQTALSNKVQQLFVRAHLFEGIFESFYLRLCILDTLSGRVEFLSDVALLRFRLGLDLFALLVDA